MKTFTKSEIDFLKENANVYGAYVCAEKMGRNFGSVLSVLRRNKIPFRYKKTDKSEKEILELTFVDKDSIDFNYDTTFFPKELSYFIGLLWADGCVNANSVIIETVKDDGEDFISIISKLCNFKIRCRKREGRREQMSFWYNDKNFANFLKTMGKYSHSSESHKKILEYIPSEYHVYFLRGLIDGDGCFYEEKYKGQILPQFSISSNFDQDWSAIVLFFSNHNIKVSVQQRFEKQSNSKSSCLRITGKDNFKKIVDILYSQKDAIYLKRKFEYAKKIILDMKEYDKKQKEKIKKYEVYYNGVLVDTIKESVIDYCRRHNFCYGSFARLTTHPNKIWRGYQLKKI